MTPSPGLISQRLKLRARPFAGNTAAQVVQVSSQMTRLSYSTWPSVRDQGGHLWPSGLLGMMPAAGDGRRRWWFDAFCQRQFVGTTMHLRNEG